MDRTTAIRRWDEPVTVVLGILLAAAAAYGFVMVGLSAFIADDCVDVHCDDTRFSVGLLIGLAGLPVVLVAATVAAYRLRARGRASFVRSPRRIRPRDGRGLRRARDRLLGRAGRLPVLSHAAHDFLPDLVGEDNSEPAVRSRVSRALISAQPDGVFLFRPVESPGVDTSRRPQQVRPPRLGHAARMRRYRPRGAGQLHPAPASRGCRMHDSHRAPRRPKSGQQPHRRALALAAAPHPTRQAPHPVVDIEVIPTHPGRQQVDFLPISDLASGRDPRIPDQLPRHTPTCLATHVEHGERSGGLRHKVTRRRQRRVQQEKRLARACLASHPLRDRWGWVQRIGEVMDGTAASGRNRCRARPCRWCQS